MNADCSHLGLFHRDPAERKISYTSNNAQSSTSYCVYFSFYSLLLYLTPIQH